MTYQQSATLAEVAAKHPFPWQEQRLPTHGGVMVRAIDANGREVALFEIMALCKIVTQAHAQRQQAQSPVTEQLKDTPA
jgi:hypothetical protein